MLTVLPLICFALQAQGFPPDIERRGPGRGGPIANAGFTALDGDRDGVISATELADAEIALKKLDRNNDGKITEDEIRPAMPEGRGRGGREGGRGEGSSGISPDDTVKTMMAMDRNGDGKIDKDELPERMQGMLGRGDENKDGALSGDEIRKLAAAQAPAPAAEAGGRGGRGPGGPEFSMMRMDPILAAVDADRDNSISSEEIRNSAVSLRKLDLNGDGRITQEEARPPMGGRRGQLQ